MTEPDKPLSPEEALAKARQERPWTTWLMLRGRPLAFAVAMLIFLIVLLLTGGGEQAPSQ
ncbi:MAG: hypothetical protein ACR2PA_22555 [Hyphomicrobiaceae bacterium]